MRRAARQKIAIVFAKRGWVRFISHLDLMRVFHRAIRRAQLPVALSEGFSPRLKIAFKRALKLGVESEGEEAVFEMNTHISPDEFRQRLQAQMPEGISIAQGNIDIVGAAGKKSSLHN